MDTLNINEEQASKIERETREQHRSSHWHAMRAGRVTASKMHSVIINNCAKGNFDIFFYYYYLI